MFVNSVTNYNRTSFKAQENDAAQKVKTQTPTEELPAVNPQNIQQAQNADLPAGDTFEPASKNVPAEIPTAANQSMIPAMQMPTLGQITKAKTTQKVLGGSIFALGALGIASALSPKKWVRLLFTIPVGGIIAYFGANMYNMANALDKLKEFAVNPQTKQ